MNERDIVVTIETVKELLRQMEECGFTSTTLHEIRVFALAQRPTPRAVDLAECTCQTPVLHPQGYCGYCGLPIPPSR